MILLVRLCAKHICAKHMGDHRKTEVLLSLTIGGCRLDCRRLHTASQLSSFWHNLFVHLLGGFCVSWAHHGYWRFVNIPCLCIWIQLSRIPWVVLGSFRKRRWIFPAIEISAMVWQKEYHQRFTVSDSWNLLFWNWEESEASKSWNWSAFGVLITGRNEARLILE